MSSRPQHKTLIETNLFTSQRDGLPSDAHLEDALRGLYWAISVGPDKFAGIPDTPWLRLAKTDDALLDAGTIRIWFEIPDDDTVELKFLEFTPSDTSGN